MSLLSDLASAVATGSVEVVDLTAPLHADTPILGLPEPFGNTWPFELVEISRYDARGSAWYWNNIRTGEHTGTHLDAPVHWVTGQDSEDVSQVPPARLVAPAVVLDFADRVADEPDFLLSIDDVTTWEAEHGPLPEGGWLLYRTGWDARAHDEAAFLNADESGPHTPGIQPDCVVEDVTSEAFRRAWGSRSSYVASGTFRAWLFRIARRTLADHYRRVQPATRLAGGSSDFSSRMAK